MLRETHILEISRYLQSLQEKIVAGLGEYEATAFVAKPWQSQLGHGTGRLVEGGQVFERAGVSVSQVGAAALPAAASVRHPELAGKPYRALGLSLVLHPHNPFVPTVHMNVRFFCADEIWWFGGGMDLTPSYGFVEDCVHFHTTCKEALEQIDPTLYPVFKQNCDEYFFLKHRQQARGIGGIFFDDYATEFAQSFALMQAVGDALLPAYLPIVARRKDTAFATKQRAHQLFRRGRYVEFNLVQDRGTLFGLQSGGAADAILMSLPPTVAWDTLATGRDPQDENNLAEQFLQPQDWVKLVKQVEG